MLNNFKCENCGRNMGDIDSELCHQCAQAERYASVIVDENGEEWVPGGYRL